ncbi:hypothetical protein Droror1_Dr00010369 [Drosera rotundifolia]
MGSSSNRHWPSMFKSKPHHHHHHLHHHDLINSNSSILSSACRTSPYSSGGGEERTPEPKPRWNPKPEQIRILEAIFNSGMVNPPRDEIRKIRAQLQEYGQVGDANVFYWFQNRKSRSKHKLRHNNQSSTTTTTTTTAATSLPQHNIPTYTTTGTVTMAVVPSSSSSSSDKSSSASKGSDNINVKHIANTLKGLGCADHLLSTSPTASVNQNNYSQTLNELIQEPFFFPVVPQTASGGGGFGNATQGFFYDDLINGNGGINHDGNDQVMATGGFSSLLLGEMIGGATKSLVDHDVEVEKMKFQQGLSFFVTDPTANANTIAAAPGAPTSASLLSSFQGESDGGYSFLNLSQKSTVFINDVAFEVPVGPFNVRDAFGDDALLVHASGHPVLTNEWGLTIQPLQNGAFYYLMRTLAASAQFEKSHESATTDLLASYFPYQADR